MPTSRTTAGPSAMPARFRGAGRLILLTTITALTLPVLSQTQTGGQGEGGAQAQPGSVVQENQPAPGSAAAPVSTVVEPATTQLAQTLPTLHPDKWKLPSDLRRRAEDNISSISTDLGSTLPGLVTAADTPQPTLGSLLALSRNFRALYDVVLRVTTAAEIAAPEQQAAALTQSLNGLATARQQLDDRLDATAATGQQQLTSLQASLAAAQASLAHSKAAGAATQPAPVVRPRPRRKPAAPAPIPAPAPPS